MVKLWSLLATGCVSLLGAGIAQAASLKNVTFSGTAPGDYFVFDGTGTTLARVPSTLSNAVKALDGNAVNPTGNVELAASSETLGFDFTKNTALSGMIAGKALTLSSLTAADWKSVGTQWIGDLVDAYLPSNLSGVRDQIKAEVGARALNEMLQRRLSDPNISYVYQDNAGIIRIGLAGFLDARPILTAGMNLSDRLFFQSLFPNPIQFSELVKYSYDGKTGYLYSFSATRSGLVAADDGISFTGNYEVTLTGHPVRAVPGPGVLVGVMAAAGLGAMRLSRRRA
jgi:hypothetical protein